MAGVETYHVKFTWKQEDGKLNVIDCDEADVPDEEYLHAVVNGWIQLNFNEIRNSIRVLEQYAAKVTVNKKQCVRMPRGRFLYMDVGRWLDGHQSFGLVCGDDAVLCDYTSGGSKPAPNISSNLMQQALQIPGVSVTAWKKIVGPHPDPNNLIVILPDMHVPAAPPADAPRPSPLPEGQQGSWRDDPHAYDEAKKLDFFNSLASKQAMISFFRDLRSALEGCNVTLIQLGDMYELWAGHPLEFSKTEDTNPVVLLSDRGGKSDTDLRVARHAVGGWIGAIHEMHANLFQEFDSCNNMGGWKTIFLHGNHDSYLSLPDIVSAANDDIAMCCSTQMDWGVRINFPKTTVYPRQPSALVQGVFVEHGQRFDGPNRDGNDYGWGKTNDAFNNFYLQAVGVPGTAHDLVGKNFDTTRRRTFVAGAAATWVATDPQFGLYVMGHTHSPELKYVEVVHQRGEYQTTYRMQLDSEGIMVRVPELTLKVTGDM